MNAPAAATFALIECEKGLGRMLPERCPGRWRIANGKVHLTPVERGRVASVINSPCRGCVHGEKRASGAPEEQSLTAVTAARSPEDVEQRAREVKQRADAVRERALANRSVEEPARTAPGRFTCEACGESFDVPGHRGPDPTTCSPKCRAEAARREPEKPQKSDPPPSVTVRTSAPAAQVEKREPMPNVLSTKTCENCEKPFKPSGPHQRYCRNPCTNYRTPSAATPAKRAPKAASADTASERIESAFDLAKRRIEARNQVRELLSGFDADIRMIILCDLMVEIEPEIAEGGASV